MLWGHRVLTCGPDDMEPQDFLFLQSARLHYRDDFTVFMLIHIFIRRILNGKVVELFSQSVVIIVILPCINENIYKINVVLRICLRICYVLKICLSACLLSLYLTEL